MKSGGPLVRRTPLKTRKPLKSNSARLKRTKKQSVVRYTGPSKKVRDAVLARDEYTCQRCARYLPGLAYSLQHRLPRGRRKIDANAMVNLVLVCGSATSPGGCHDEIEHQQRALATLEGWFVPNGIDPADWPALRFRESWALPGEPGPDSTGWEPAEPHELQVRGWAA